MGSVRSARASTRSAFADSASACAVSAARPASSRSFTPSAVRTRVHRGSSTSTAPLQRATTAPSSRVTTVMRLRALLNGTVCSTARPCIAASRVTPPFSPRTSSAPSVGSPVSTTAAPLRATLAVFTTTAATSARRTASGSSVSAAPSLAKPPSRPSPSPLTSYDASAVASARTVISLRVSVPVLSEQITVAQPSVSTAASLRTSAPRCAMRCMPSARVMDVIAGSPSGITATATLTAVSSSTCQGMCPFA